MTFSIMHPIEFFCLLFSVILQLSASPNNRPALCVNAQWNPFAITFIDDIKLGGSVIGFSIDSNDYFYALRNSQAILSVWSLTSGSANPINITFQNVSSYSNILVTDNNYAYFESSVPSCRIIRQSLNSTHNDTVAVFGGECRGLFIDTNNMLYCSLTMQHRIDTLSLNHTSAPLPTVRAGNGTQGSSTKQLNMPWGIFVDTNFDLYVADAMNNRIQVFRSENTTADTIIGPATHANCILQFPTDIILDRDSNVYIADNRNHRIVRVTWIGCQCLVGCSGTSGFSSNQLNISYSLRFDSYGNLFVVDEGNHRVQKFPLTSRCQTSSNQPELCWNATWASNAITFTDNSTLQTEARGIFVDTDDTVYLARYQHGDILRWMKGRNRTNPDHIITGSVFVFDSLFVNEAKEIYFETAWQAGRIEKRSVNGSSNVFVAQFIDQCRGLFIDVTNTLYCSVHTRHLISSVSLNTNNSGYITRAGNGINGSVMNQLDSPWGIFVDVSLNLYVADTQNHRIQCFEANEMNGTTVAGQGFPSGLTLSCPTDVILDGNNHIYIADNNNHRIIKVSSTRYKCLLGCSGVTGSASNQLSLAYSLRFDSYGNLYVADEYNNRMQKLPQIYNCESVPYNRPKNCMGAIWNETASTFADDRTTRAGSLGFFIDRENTFYLTDPPNRQILMRSLNYNQSNWTAIPNVSVTSYSPLFVTIERNIYFVDDTAPAEVWSRLAGTSLSTRVVIFDGQCFGLFIDLYKTLYCSVKDRHYVATKLLYDEQNITTIRAGNGTNGSSLDQLSSPWGIFVDIDLNLYVADTNNHRIQMFRQNETRGITVVGSNASYNLQLHYPTDVILDGDGDIYIADNQNHRVIRVGSGTYQCLIGCSSQPTSTSNPCYRPYSLRFDSFGNLFIVDEKSLRIQKFPISAICNRTSVMSMLMIGPMTSTQASATASSLINAIDTPCSILKPCQNDGVCIVDPNDNRGYVCCCLNDFDGSECQHDRRPRQRSRCLNNGTCQSLANDSFHCKCASGYEGTRCHKRTNFCDNVTCENGGVCQSLSVNYRCLCLNVDYSGVLCESMSTRIRIYQISSLSIAYVAIAMIVSCATFILMMDILKYGFGIDDPKIKQDKNQKKSGRKRPNLVSIVHYRYVNYPDE